MLTVTLCLGGAVGGLSCCTLDIHGAHLHPASVCTPYLSTDRHVRSGWSVRGGNLPKLLASRSRAAECCSLKLKRVWLSRLPHHAHEVMHSMLAPEVTPQHSA